MIRSILAILLTMTLAACTAAPPPADPFAESRTPDGTVVWQGEYEFVPPPPPWTLLMLDEEDYSVAFYRSCGDLLPGVFPCESTIAYAEEPFGFSRDFERRQKEFFRRFLWAARVEFDPPELKPATALGGEALLAETVGRERVLNQKVLVRVLFAHRGERVVAFYLTQWRPADREFDRSQLPIFDDFVDSFRFRKPSFYQTLSAD